MLKGKMRNKSFFPILHNGIARFDVFGFLILSIQ